ncbi:hypothetical protein Alches_18390 [Alicyclobacillus hesperidum subsp. aegles]|uniref:Rha family transcriptional regulator n=1 Tax=Alicyclobacillus hesperidum TaxID=89784 RepID=UPI0022295383|nr:Rha family transcriptional regulator [Alicyclobacillus hesperidum]GLG01799.1 hypothetical protein Alches_18390 [Alicyclobacillus hesperidum subsp. aegles]
MTKLILNPEYGLYERNGRAFCGSRELAKGLNRQHSHVLRTIDELTQSTSGLSEEFRRLNFEESKYKDSSGRGNREVLLTKDGFIMTVMEIKGAKARAFKEAYIARFNAMEAFIRSLQTTKMEFPAFTEAVMSAHEEPKHYHFSNEINMIYRIVLGMDAKAFRQLHGLDKEAVIRPYLTVEQIQAIEALQRVDIGLLVAVPDYQQRKQLLQEHYARMQRKRIA